jgi:hypothetical protein
MSAFSSVRHPVDTTGAALMTLLCLLWGFTYVFSKLAAADISLVLQGGLRSVIAALLLLVWARARGIPMFRSDGTLAAGLVAGALFAAGLSSSSPAGAGASRGGVNHLALRTRSACWLVPSERCTRCGVIALAAWSPGPLDGFVSERSLGDAFGDRCPLWAAPPCSSAAPG